jgi:hypothetical protein
LGARRRKERHLEEELTFSLDERITPLPQACVGDYVFALTGRAGVAADFAFHLEAYHERSRHPATSGKG